MRIGSVFPSATMTDDTPRHGVGEYDKHPSIRGQPLNAINQQPIPLERPIDRQVMPGELRGNVPKDNLKGRQLLRAIARPAEGTAPAPAGTILLSDDCDAISAQSRFLRIS
jgi:hypothetical protein